MQYLPRALTQWFSGTARYLITIVSEEPKEH